MNASDVKLVLKVWRYRDGGSYVTVEPSEPEPDLPTLIIAGEPKLHEGRGQLALCAPVDMDKLMGAMCAELNVSVLGLVALARVEIEDVPCDCPRCVALREASNELN